MSTIYDFHNPANYSTYESCFAEIKKSGLNIRNVPSGLISKKMCIEALVNNCPIELIPKEFVDSDLFSEAVFLKQELVFSVPESFLNTKILKLVPKENLTKQWLLNVYFVEEVSKEEYSNLEVFNAIIFDHSNILYLPDPRNEKILKMVAQMEPDILDKLEVLPFSVCIIAIRSEKITKYSLWKKISSQHRSLNMCVPNKFSERINLELDRNCSLQ